METHVVIVGAGFGGLRAAKHLARADGITISLIDKQNHHLFQPLLYQVATAGLSPADIAVPIRAQFSDANVSVHLFHVEALNLAEKWIELEGDVKLSFDYLILACGAQHSYFGKP